MITALTRSDASRIINFDEQVFDLEAAYVEWIDNEPRDDRQGVFHPSAVGGCARRNVYEYIRTPRVFMDKTKDMEVFRLGHAIHHIIQTIMSDLKRVLTPKGIEFSFEAEVPYDRNTDSLYLDFGIGGTTDGILEIWHPKQGWRQRGVLEIKSSKGETFNDLKNPKPDHEMQANLYAFRFDAPIIWYWYYNKNTSDRKVFKRLANDQMLETAITRFASQREHADNGTLPDREESFWMCPRCEYGHVCQPPTLTKIRVRESVNKQAIKGGFGKR